MERKLKRRFERGYICNEMRTRVIKITPKKKKLKFTHLRELSSSRLEKERLFDIQHSGDNQLLLSEMSFSELEESEDEDAICPAVNCLQPEGDEVCSGQKLQGL